MTHQRLCVFTTLIGRYERLNEQPVAARSSIPFLCLTDDPDLRSDSWQVRRVSPLFAKDLVRSQRMLKIRADVHLPDFDASIYIDNSVLLTEPPERLLERYQTIAGLCLPRHSFRDSVLDEFLRVIRSGRDDHERVLEQLDHYAVEYPDLLQERPYWTGIMLRDHRNPAVCAAQEIWAAHVLRYSRRDQLSANVAFMLGGVQPTVMDIDNYASWFHSWPHTAGRGQTEELSSRSPAPDSVPARGRRVEKALAEREPRQDMLLTIPTWRLAARLEKWAHRHPRLALMAWRVIRPFV